MTAVQSAFAAGVALGAISIAWFAVLVVARTIKVDNGWDFWLAVKGWLSGRDRLMDRGQMAHCCHRVSGLAVFAFLCLHVVDVGVISISHEAYDQIQVIYAGLPMRIMESVLLLAILFHALNGLRLIAADVFPLATKTTDRLTSWVFAVSLLVGLPAACIILAPAIS